MPSPLWARNCDNRSILSGGWGARAKVWWGVATFHQPLILIDAFSNLIFVIVFTVHFLRDHPKSGPPPAEAPPKHSCPHPQIYTAVRGIFVLISASWHRNLTSMVSLVTQTQCPGPNSQLLGWWGADSRTKIFHQNCMLDSKHHVPTQFIEARHSRLPKRNDFQS